MERNIFNKIICPFENNKNPKCGYLFENKKCWFQHKNEINYCVDYINGNCKLYFCNDKYCLKTICNDKKTCNFVHLEPPKYSEFKLNK